MREGDVRARMANQADRHDRLARADHVVDNSGTPHELATRVAELWEDLSARGSAS